MIAVRLRASVALSLLVTTGVLFLLVAGGASAASFPGIWRAAGRLPAGSLTGVSCPSASLCVAIDGSGDVFSSTDPAAGAKAWSKTSIDGTNGLTGVACVSRGLCVAVDSAGNLATSTDPADGAWAVSNLEGANQFIGVACPSGSLCVAATATDLLVSKDPAAGASSWQITPNADAATGPECGKYGGNDGCAVSMDFLSCGSSTSCTAVDDYGGTLSGDPLTGTWTSNSGGGLQIDGLACLSDGTCLTECSVGAGLAGQECTVTTYDATDLCAGPAGCSTISNQQLSGLWCRSSAMCFATDQNGDLIASTSPTAGTTAWTTVFLRPTTNRYQPVTGVSCPTSSLCAAVTGTGQLLLGSPLPPASQIKRLLATELSLTPAQASPAALLKQNGCSRKFSSPSAGQLAITWTAPAKPGSRRRSVIAKGTGKFKSSGTIKIKILLTKAGKRLLRAGHSVQVASSARLAHTGSSPITATRTFQLKK
jgi:hypothetical protein